MRCDGLTDLQIKDCSISESRRWRLENTTETYNYAVSSSRAALESSRLIHPDATLKLLDVPIEVDNGRIDPNDRRMALGV
jgi:hypothetical protein